MACLCENMMEEAKLIYEMYLGNNFIERYRFFLCCIIKVTKTFLERKSINNREQTPRLQNRCQKCQIDRWQFQIVKLVASA